MAYKGGKLSDGTPLNIAVYRAYRNAGLSHNQALAITAEVGRENSFSAGILFGNHTDPAANSGGKPIRNMGMLSWNQGRDVGLERYLNQQGVMRGGQMAKTQANLNAQAQFSVREMKSKRYAPKLKNFWSNPNASPESYAKELGKNYIVWAYGQNTIKARGGGRQAFNWKAHDGYRRGYLNTLNSMLGGKERYTPQQNESYQAQQQPLFQAPSFRPSSDLQGNNKPLFAVPDWQPASKLEQGFKAPDWSAPSDNTPDLAAQVPLFQAPEWQSGEPTTQTPLFESQAFEPESALISEQTINMQPPDIDKQGWQT